MPSVSTQHPRLTSRQLLVSVQSAAEAEIALTSGVPWVDLKNPSAGSLGRPAPAVVREFLAVAARHPASRVSLALGEWDEVDWEQLPQLLQSFSVGKIGLAGQASHIASMARYLSEPSCSRLHGKIVLAIYADWQRANAPAPEHVLELACSIGAPYVLVDTHIKDGLGLFQWMSVEQLNELRKQAALQGAELVVAGSLRSSDWPTLELLDQVVIGVRGAVCHESHDRTSALSADHIHDWLRWSTESPFAPPKVRRP